LKLTLDSQSDHIIRPRAYGKEDRKVPALVKSSKTEYPSLGLFRSMALGRRSSLHYDYELHCKVHYNAALAQHPPQNPGILADAF
jgi:hypothetical protein